MRFNLFFVLKGPARTIEAPNQANPVEANSLAGLLAQLAGKLPNNKEMGIEVVGVKILPHVEEQAVIQEVTEGQLKTMLPNLNIRGSNRFPSTQE